MFLSVNVKIRLRWYRGWGVWMRGSGSKVFCAEWVCGCVCKYVCSWAAVTLVWCNWGDGRVCPPTRALCWCSGGATALTVRDQNNTREQHSQNPSTTKREIEGEKEDRRCFGRFDCKGVELDWIMATSTSCTGSTLLQPISNIIDLPLDQVNCHFNRDLCFAFVILPSKDR